MGNLKNNTADETLAKQKGLFNPKFSLPSPKPPMDPHSPDDMKKWVVDNLKYITGTAVNGKKLIDENGAWRIHLVFDNFPPEYLEYYQALQEAIAEKIEEEEFRPTITLKIRGSNRINSTPFYGYIGGTGPLSDAATILSVREAYDERLGDGLATKNMAVDLLSAPPPRTDTVLEGIKRTSQWYRYGVRVSKFSDDCGAQNITVLSNTAHLNLFTVKFLMYARRAYKWDFMRILKSIVLNSETVVNSMVKRIVNMIKDGDEKNSNIREYKATDKILILGTQKAFKNKLYDKVAKKEGANLNFVYPGDPNEAVNRADELQALIDLIKKGKTNEITNNQNTAGEELVNFFLRNLTNDTTHLLLACTEIPLCFHKKLPDDLINKYQITQVGATYQDLFLHRFKEIYPNNEQPIIINSEESFAVLTVNQALINESKYDNLPIPPIPHKVGHGLMVNNSDDSMPQVSTYTGTKEAIPVPRAIYENKHTFTQIEHFADKGLIVYRPPEECVTIDFTEQTPEQKGEMAIAAIEASLKLGVTEPIELSGDDLDAVIAGAKYCANQGIGFYVADNMMNNVPIPLQCGEPKRAPTVSPEEVQQNIASLTDGAPVAQPSSQRPRMR